MNIEKKFAVLMGVILLFFSFLYMSINLTINAVNKNVLFIAFVIINIFFVLFITAVLFAMLITILVLKGKKINKNIMKINFKTVKFFYALIMLSARMLKISKNEIRSIFVNLNNRYIYSQKYNLNASDIIILTPHCIQKNYCKHKITTDINNCISCGNCDVSELLKINKKYNIDIYIVTGGTLARKIISNRKPKAVIAVACERDLMSGMQDVDNISIIGIFNKRPNGPCINTMTDIVEIENAIKFLMEVK